MKQDMGQWSVNDVMKLFQTEVSRQTIIASEREGRIPPAVRSDRGGVKARIWTTKDLPAIGKMYGFIQKPKKQVRISVYMAKGGVLKTTISYTLARILALHGLKVLLVGLDSQGSLTNLTLNPLDNIESLDQIPVYKHIGNVLFSGAAISEVVEHTDLPTLDIIPETDALSDLNTEIGTKAAVGATSKNVPEIKRFQYFSKLFLPKVSDYDVILFDNSPSWSFLIENSTYASDYLIIPAACDPGTYQSLDTNLNATFDMADKMGRQWQKVFLVPTLKESNKLSSQIYASYLNRYPDLITTASIRRTVKGAEAFSISKSPIEFDAGSELASDYFALAKEVWANILRDQNGNQSQS